MIGNASLEDDRSRRTASVARRFGPNPRRRPTTRQMARWIRLKIRKTRMSPRNLTNRRSTRCWSLSNPRIGFRFAAWDSHPSLEGELVCSPIR
jgi:hypothetical protein